MMRSRRWFSLTAVALGASSFTRAGGRDGDRLGLAEFRRVLRTGLDDELAKIVAGAQRPSRPADQRERHTKGRSKLRARPDDGESSASPHQSYFTTQIWDDLVQYSWNQANAVRRDHRLSVTANPEEACPRPFMICARGEPTADGDGLRDVLALFDTRRDDALLLSSSRDETCLILTVTAARARAVVDRGGRELQGRTLAAMPLLDVAKIHAGTIDEVGSRAWAVPSARRDGGTPDAAAASKVKNATEALDHWERVIVVDLAPGVGGMKEEAALLKVVNGMMSDIQDMGEVGSIRSLDDAEEWLIEESLVGVPSLSDAFSLTSSLRAGAGNARVAFWRDAFARGIEAEHLCGEMFSTLFVRPRPGYRGYDLVMNPADGPPAADDESSAANPACVASLIAALATHPYVLSVEARFPAYHGWRVAQELDAA